jgi:hypothetical protein
LLLFPVWLTEYSETRGAVFDLGRPLELEWVLPSDVLCPCPLLDEDLLDLDGFGHAGGDPMKEDCGFCWYSKPFVTDCCAIAATPSADVLIAPLRNALERGIDRSLASRIDEVPINPEGTSDGEASSNLLDIVLFAVAESESGVH